MIDSRQKGIRFEQEIAAFLRPVYPDAHRGIQARGEEAADVVIPDFWIECKRKRAPDIRAAFEQARLGARVFGKIPLAITRKDRGRTLVTMDLDCLLAMLERWIR